MKQKGFTLIELILYVGALALIVLLVSNLLTAVLASRSKHRAIAEVEGQGLQILQLVTQRIRNAATASVLAPGTVLSLTGPAGQITVSLVGNEIRLAEGGTTYPITSSLLLATALTFEDLSWPGTPGVIRIEFSLAYKNPENLPELDYRKIFYGTAALR